MNYVALVVHVQEEDAGVSSVLVAASNMIRIVSSIRHPPWFESFYDIVRWRIHPYLTITMMALHTYVCFFARPWEYPLIAVGFISILGAVTAARRHYSNTQVYECDVIYFIIIIAIIINIIVIIMTVVATMLICYYFQLFASDTTEDDHLSLTERYKNAKSKAVAVERMVRHALLHCLCHRDRHQSHQCENGVGCADGLDV